MTSRIPLALVLCAAACGRESGEPPPPEAAAPPSVPSASAAYVGLEACRECHLEQYSTYMHTGMGRSFYPMTAAEVVEDFDEQNEFAVEGSPLRYRMIERDGSFYQRQFLLDSKGNEIAVDEHRLDFVIGSNNHCRSYVITMGDRLFQAPICWYPQASRWDLCPGFEFNNDHFSREIGRDCVNCHNGAMRLAEGTRNRYAEPYPHGIDCERCHGPGEMHVAKWRGGEVPTGDPDPTIVHPRRLPPARRIEVCLQCHLADAKSTERVFRTDRDPADYRPGESLLEYMIPYHYEEPARHEFGLSSQGDRLLLSRCYKESGGKIECLTCHNPHVTIYREDRPLDYFQKRCLSCHETADCTAPPAERQATSPLPDDCVKCHMRKGEPDDQRFTAFTDHWIRRDIRGDDEPHVREDYEIGPMWPEAEAGLSDAERAYYRSRAVYLLLQDAPKSRYEEMWRTAEGLMSEATAKGLASAEVWFYLGKTRHYLGRRAEAAQAFRQAYELDPAYHNAAFAHAQSLLEAGETARALEVFQGMLARKPDDAMALAEIARALTLVSSPAEALAPLDRALAAEPWDWKLHLSRGKVLAAQGRYDDAIAEARDVVRLNPDEPDAWSFYERLHGVAGRPDEAREGRRILEQIKP